MSAPSSLPTATGTWPQSPPGGPHKHGVVAVLVDAAGRYLFIRRGLGLARAPGVWCFVGGEVEPGETLEQALEREVREEVGLPVRAGGKIHESQSPNGEYLLHWLRADVQGNCAEIRAHPVEVAEWRWLSAAEAGALAPLLPTLAEWLAAVRPISAPP